MYIYVGITSCLFLHTPDSQTAKEERDATFLLRYGQSREAFMAKSAFYTTNGYTWDFVLILKSKYTEEENNYFANYIRTQHSNAIVTNSMNNSSNMDTNSSRIHALENDDVFSELFIQKVIIRRLRNAGFEYYMKISTNKKQIFMKIRIPLQCIMQAADECKYVVPLCSDEVEVRLEGIGIQYLARYQGIILSPFVYIYSNYKLNIKYSRLFYNSNYNNHKNHQNIALKSQNNPFLLGSEELVLSEKHIFNQKDRIYIINNILQNNLFINGCELNLHKLQYDGILEYYAMHDEEDVRRLSGYEWVYPWSCPIRQIKDYYGIY